MSERSTNRRLEKLEADVRRVESSVAEVVRGQLGSAASPGTMASASPSKPPLIMPGRSTGWWDTIRRKSRELPWMNVLQTLGIFAGVFYAVINYLQWHDLRKNFQTDERAWLNIDSSWPKLDNASPPSAEIVFQNVGKSPISSIHGEGRMEVLRSEDAPSLSLRTLHYSMDRAALFPTVKDTFPIYLMDGNSKSARAFTPEEIKGLQNGSFYIAIFGTLAYTDEFGPHWYRFCSWNAYAQAGNFNSWPCVKANAIGDGKALESN